MAGDWIPISVDLIRRLEVLLIARDLHVSAHAVVGLLVEFWAWASGESTDGELPGLTLESLADLGGFNRGFLDALTRAKWLLEKENGLAIPNFERWLSDGAKKRFQDRDRQRNRRSGGQNNNPGKSETNKRRADESTENPVTKMSRCERDKNVTTGQDRTGQIGEETQPKPFPLQPTADVPAQPSKPRKAPEPLPTVPDALATPDFLEAWTDWQNHRREIKKPLTPTTAKTQLAALAKVGPTRAVETIRRSLERGWQGLFPEAIDRPPGEARETFADRQHREMLEEIQEGLSGGF